MTHRMLLGVVSVAHNDYLLRTWSEPTCYVPAPRDAGPHRFKGRINTVLSTNPSPSGDGIRGSLGVILET